MKQLFIAALVAGLSNFSFAAQTLESVTPACENGEAKCYTMQLAGVGNVTLREGLPFFNRSGKQFLEANKLPDEALEMNLPEKFTYSL